MRSKLKVVLVFGTRPEAIKMAPVILELRQHEDIEPIVCVTGQHRHMLDEALNVFDIKPDFDLDIMRPGQPLAAINAAVLNKLTPLLTELKPDRILVHGDTTTTFSAAVASFYLQIPIGHVEAGLRTGNLSAPWPEEFNRRCVDTIADLLWAPTQRAVSALEKDQAAPQNIFLTGNTGVDALRIMKARIEDNSYLYTKLKARLPAFDASKKLILVTGHRRENFDGGLKNLCQILNILSQRSDTEIVWPVHPNPQVTATTGAELKSRKNIHLIEPLDYLGFIALMMRSYFIITDSGGIQEEAPSLGKPVLVTRDVTERIEAIEAGTAKLVGASCKERMLEAAEQLLDNPDTHAHMASAANPFGDGYAAQKIVSTLLHRHH